METAINQIRSSLYQVRGELRSKRMAQLRREITQALVRKPMTEATVYLFGSWANGKFDGQSDVDLLVLAPDRTHADEAARRLMPAADDVIIMTESDWLRRCELHDPFIRRILGERVLLVDTRRHEHE